jgi:hypothetical protein
MCYAYVWLRHQALSLERTFPHGRLLPIGTGNFTITQEGKAAIDSGTSGERGKD